jgi:hypothetical protein
MRAAGSAYLWSRVAARMFDRLAALTHGLRVRIKALLHRFEQMLVLPARDPPLRPRRALGFERAVLARGWLQLQRWGMVRTRLLEAAERGGLCSVSLSPSLIADLHSVSAYGLERLVTVRSEIVPGF